MLHSQIKHMHTYKPGIYHFQRNKTKCLAHVLVETYIYIIIVYKNKKMNITQPIYRRMDPPYSIHRLKYYTEMKINELFLMHQYG